MTPALRSGRNRRRARAAAAFLLLAAAVAAPSAAAQERVYVPPACPGGDAASREEAALLRCLAPVFVVDEGERSFNRIGTPEIRREKDRDRVRVNPEVPALFGEVRRDRIGSTDVLHLVFRVHFERLPFKASVFFERHRNVGVLTIVTVREADLAPALLTTAYTCGCYRALLPTDRLESSALPPRWPAGTRRVFGRDLPAIVRAPARGESRFVVHLASKTHRVRDIETLPQAPAGAGMDLPLRGIDELRRIPIEGTDGEVGSFFYTRGFLKGHVRGAWSPIEGLTAGLLLLDPMLGMDKDLGDPGTTGTRFYTSLLPWRREASRLDRFEPLLRLLGFRTDNFGVPATGDRW